MKPVICSATITSFFLALTAICKAQYSKINIEQPATALTSTLPTAKTDSLQIKKKAKKRREHADTAFNPYQPPAAVVKPLPYNSYREQPAPAKEGTGAGIIKDILSNKKNN